MNNSLMPIGIYDVVASENLIGHHSYNSIYFSSIPVELNPLSEKIFFLDRCSKLQANWDGYGAKSPNERVIRNAKNFLGALPPNYQKMLNIDEVSVTPYGTVLFDWNKDEDHFISIEIGNSKIGYFSETPDGLNPSEDGVEINPHEIPNQVLSAINKVFLY